MDGRSDLYSLGVLLYQLVCGRLPHHGDSMARLMYQIANEAPPDIRRFRPDLPEALALVLALALEKRPELRYQDGEQMARDLDTVVQMLTGDAPAPSGWTPMSPSRLSHKPCACRQRKQGRIRPPPIRKFRPPAHDSGVLQCH